MYGKKMFGKILQPTGFAVLLAATATIADGAENRPGLEEIEKHDWRRMEDRLPVGEEETARETTAEKKEDNGIISGLLGQYVGLSGLVEVEAAATDNYEGESGSDLALATVELDFHVRPNDWAQGHILLLWEDGAEHLDVDEAVLSLGNPEKSPFYLNAGKLYVPFGTFGSFMIQDPLPLELGETNETAVQIGAEYNDFFGSVFAFNGDIDETGSTNNINNFGTSVGYVYEGETVGISAGIDYINNLADADMLTEALMSTGTSTVKEYVPGLGVHLQLTHGPFTFYSEYIIATDQFGADELEFQGQGAKPAAWHFEVIYTRDILARETNFALGCQGTGEAANLGLPEKRYMAAVSVALTDYLSWALEFVHDEDYESDAGGTGQSADLVTTQLAFTF